MDQRQRDERVAIDRQLPIGRMGGCLWLILAGWLFIGLAAATGVSIAVGDFVGPLLLPPVALALIVFIGGRSRVVLVISSLTAFVYAGLGVWNYIRAAEFERLNPGATEVSGGEMSVVFVLLALATGLWSAGAAGLAMRETRTTVKWWVPVVLVVVVCAIAAVYVLMTPTFIGQPSVRT